MNWIRNNIFQIIFLVIGAIAGFLYWRFIGCENGTCAIKSVWYWSTLWGAVVGYLIGDTIKSAINFINKKRKN